MIGPYVLLRWLDREYAQILCVDGTWTPDQDSAKLAKLESLYLAQLVVQGVERECDAFALPLEVALDLFRRLEQSRKAGGQ